ncbi:MAG: 30S ribosome-binding factor RbfA [Proteobacteria bacterium]|jgi:ribosome-binding factor A|nr:30S ribosome-binding factor RbfA [Pseudomonadota bacterium]MBK9253128.1 30S ribosome-binding factor RbfA [Pseudomonadota bacterium]MCC6631977.1 30S ribosome-binding factor RbfA [Gammaproteobacteria bacterium]
MAGKGSGSGRLQRMEGEMQRVLAELVSRELKDPRVGPVTVTQVALARDLSYARVFVVPFGGNSAHPQMLEGLAAAAGFLRGEVGRRVGMRHAPRLQFVHDESFDRAAELTALIDSANRPRS